MSDKEIEELKAKAEEGDPSAQNQLGVMYSEGRVVPQDFLEGVRWYRRSANQGYHWGQYNLGLHYYFGHGLTRNREEAFECFMKAAEQDNAHAQFQLASVYSLGEGTEKNFNEAFKYLCKSAENGFKDARSVLGSLYVDGFYNSRDYPVLIDENDIENFEKDRDKGIELLKLAALDGDRYAKRKLNDLKEEW